jgi:hypothetical protein
MEKFRKYGYKTKKTLNNVVFYIKTKNSHN